MELKPKLKFYRTGSAGKLYRLGISHSSHFKNRPPVKVLQNNLLPVKRSKQSDHSILFA